MIAAAWLIVFCFTDKREKKARQRYAIFYDRSSLVYRAAYDG